MMQIIQAKIDSVQSILESKGYSKFQFETIIGKLKPGMSGCAVLNSNKILLSIHYLNEFMDNIINDTLPHEICHLYVKRYFPFAKQHHGPEFRFLMNLLGLKGETYHRMQLKEGPVKAKRVKIRYVYVAESENKKVELTQMQHSKAISGIATYTLKTTGEKLKYTGEIRKFV